MHLESVLLSYLVRPFRIAHWTAVNQNPRLHPPPIYCVYAIQLNLVANPILARVFFAICT